VVVDKKGYPVVRTAANGKKYYISRQAATYKGAAKYNGSLYFDNPSQEAYPNGDEIAYVTQNNELKNAGVRKGDIGYVVAEDGSITYFVVSDFGDHG
ncbi:hypothetical protein, partial [Streptomyces galilaeus]|uniref:hypothetical protein n=1 Tax=Streptomyces galilaeus TaxID=33899 RepID=UPI0038F6FCF2